MTIVSIVTTTVMSLLLLVPLATLFITSVRGPFLPFGVPEAGWGLSNFAKLVGVGDQLLDTLRVTGIYVVGATIISMFVGGILAFLFIRTNIPGRLAIGALAFAPYVLPPIVGAQAMLLMLGGKTGILNQLLRLLPFVSGDSGPIDPFALPVVVVLQGVLAVTFPFMMLIPVFKNMDGSLEEAARTSGASMFRTLRSVTIPVLWPAILGVAILQVILLLGALEVPLLFGQQSANALFSLRVYSLLTPSSGQLPSYGLAAAYGVCFLIITLLIFQIYRRAMKNAERRASVTGKGYRASRVRLGKWTYVFLPALAIYLFITTILPFAALAWRAVTPYAIEFSFANLSKYFSLDSFGAVLADSAFWSSLWRTAILATVSSTISVVLAVVSAYVVARRRRSIGTTALDMLASSSVAIPATIAGFAAFLFYMVTDPILSLNGTLLALILTYAYKVTVSYRLTHSAVLQIGTELEEAAATSGAGRLTRLRQIVFPLVLPTSVVTWLGLLILNSHEFTVAAFLATPESRPLSILLYERITPASGMMYAPGQGAAMALIFTVIVFVVGFGLQFAYSRHNHQKARKNQKLSASTRGTGNEQESGPDFSESVGMTIGG